MPGLIQKGGSIEPPEPPLATDLSREVSLLDAVVIMCTTLAVDIPNVMMIVPASLGRSLSDILGSSPGQPPKKVTSMRPGANSIATVEWRHLGSTPSGTGIWNGTESVLHVAIVLLVLARIINYHMMDIYVRDSPIC